MAQSRTQTRRGMTAVHVWLIGFVFLWLVSMVLLVWLYNDQESIRKDNDDLRNRYAKVSRIAKRISGPLEPTSFIDLMASVS